MKTRLMKAKSAANNSPSPGGEGRGEGGLWTPETISLLESCSLIYDAIVREQEQERQIFTADADSHRRRDDVRELTLHTIRCLLTTEIKIVQ